MGNLVNGGDQRGPIALVWGIATLHTIDSLHFGEFHAPGDVWRRLKVAISISWVCTSAIVPFGLREIDDSRFFSVLHEVKITLQRVVDYPSLVNLANSKHNLSAVGQVLRLAREKAKVKNGRTRTPPRQPLD